MDFFRHFTVLICAPTFNVEDLEGLRLDQITVEIEKLGFEVVRARRVEDAEIAVQTDAAIGCMVVDWGKKGLEGKTADLINLMRRRGLEMPIIILVRRKRLEDIPIEVLDYIDGYIFLAEETPEFIARNLVSRLKQYAETLKTPFFGALVDYAERGNQLWTCPGHNGGIFYNRSPIGRIFVEHLGQDIFRDDLDNSVLELGDLLVHEGPALKAQQEAAAIFGAEKTYFVLNGTSSSNKIVLSALVAQGDLVLFDRNNHKAAHHGALFLGGGIPIYLETDRNAHGLIGPIWHQALDETAIREKIRHHPLVADPEAWKRDRPFRVAVIEQREIVGGACVNTGTIPSKTMREAVMHLLGFQYQGIYGSNYHVKERILMADLGFRVNQVIKTEVKQNDDVLMQILRNAMRRMTDKENIRIRVCPTDAARIKAEREDVMQIVDGIRNLGTYKAANLTCQPFDMSLKNFGKTPTKVCQYFVTFKNGKFVVMNNGKPVVGKLVGDPALVAANAQGQAADVTTTAPPASTP